MKNICVVQHTEAEFLGLMEDHFEGRNIRFHYQRPFAAGGVLPKDEKGYDGLILLGGGPYGVVSGHVLPSLTPELALTKAFLEAGLPVIGIELGAIILSIAAGGGATEAPLRFVLERVQGKNDAALGGYLPSNFAMAAYGRDRAVLPEGAIVLASGDGDKVALYSLGGNCLGFSGHPGMKSGMCEDLIMEFSETPKNTAATLDKLRAVQGEIAASLSAIMVGVLRHTGL